jgi:hypothetical protein
MFAVRAVLDSDAGARAAWFDEPFDELRGASLRTGKAGDHHERPQAKLTRNGEGSPEGLDSGLSGPRVVRQAHHERS